MSQIILLIGTSAFLFLLSIILSIIGFIRKQRKLKFIALFAFVFSIAGGFYTTYTVTNKTYHFVEDKHRKLKKLFPERTPERIYAGQHNGISDCVEVIQYQDMEIPIIDMTLPIEAKICPEEFERILKNKDYKLVKFGAMNTDSNLPSTFNFETLGDTIYHYSYYEEQVVSSDIWVNKSKTRLISLDMYF